MVTAAVHFENVSKQYPTGLLGRGRLTAVQGISLRIEPGEVFGLVGPNRAGKTTLVKVLLSLCRPTTGRADRLGRPADDRRTLARVGYLHEQHAFPGYLTVRGLLEFYGSLALVPDKELGRRIPELLACVGLADRADEPLARFSKGMLQRAGLAQALVNDPDLLVLDEPSEGLDLLGRRLVRDVIAEQRRRGRTVLLVSHVAGEVEQVCDRVGVLVGGRLVYLGSVADLARDPATGAPRRLEQALEALYDRGNA
jgi:ABC-2 type transport system ATP-binding protein